MQLVSGEICGRRSARHGDPPFETGQLKGFNRTVPNVERATRNSIMSGTGHILEGWSNDLLSRPQSASLKTPTVIGSAAGKLVAHRDLQDPKAKSNLGGSHALTKRSSTSRARTARTGIDASFGRRKLEQIAAAGGRLSL
jgi:hypothetical protein